MSETRSHISGNDILHVAEVAQRRVRATSWWRIAIFIIIAIPALVGFIDVLSRISSLFASAQAAQLAAPEPCAAASSDISNPADSGGIIPVRLQIPSVGVSAPVERVGLNTKGDMQAPSNFVDVGWYQNGSEPGASGSAVIDGHVNNALTEAGVFEHLAQVGVGDRIILSDASGQTRTFTVVSVKTYPVNAAPLEEIFSHEGPSQLALITCEGVWDAAEHQFSNRLVVFASLASSTSIS